MSEAQDGWLARVEKNLMLVVEEPYYNKAASSCFLLEPTPINEASSRPAVWPLLHLEFCLRYLGKW
jgi:hypothetical protein